MIGWSIHFQLEDIPNLTFLTVDNRIKSFNGNGLSGTNAFQDLEGKDISTLDGYSEWIKPHIEKIQTANSEQKSKSCKILN